MKKYRFRIFCFFTIIVFCICFVSRIFENDTFYMIKLGEYITNNGIDFMDHWCFLDTLPYTYPHWLYDVFVYFVYNFFGFFGIYVSNIIIFILLIFSIYFVNWKINKNSVMAFLVSLVSIFGLSSFVTARSQVLSYIIFILEVYFIYMLGNSGKKRYVVYLMILSLGLANIHATIWMFYFFLFLPFLGEYFVSFLKSRFNIRFNDKFIVSCVGNFKLLVSGFVLSFLMGIFSPSRICYTYIFKVMMGDSQSYIVEHLPLVVISNYLFMGLCVCFLIVLIFTDTRIRVREFFMVCGLVLMSLMSYRHTALFCLIGGLYLSVICMRYLNDKGDRTFEVLESFFCKKSFVCYLSFVVVLGVGGMFFYKNMEYSYVSCEEYPVDAVKYILENIDLDDYRGFNGYNYGSYLLFNDIPVFIDSRCDLYLKEFNGMNLDVFGEAINIFDDYEKTFDKYDINYVLINNDNIFCKLLKKDKDYDVEYDDKYFTLFKRNIEG